MNLILFGFKGSGKTHLGKLLSRELDWPFLDTDDLLCKLYSEPGLTPRDIHQREGEAAFRALERDAIHLLKPDARTVIALGGGTVLDPKNVRALQQIGVLVYLKASFETIKQRMLHQPIPSFVHAEDPIEALYDIYCERLPIYESIPAICIDVDGLDEQGCLAALKSILYSQDKGASPL